MNIGYVYFALRGTDFNPDLATQRLGIQPTSVTYKGEVKPGKSANFYYPPAKGSSWKLSTEEVTQEDLDVYAMALEITSQLEHKADEIARLVQELQLEAYLEVVLYITQEEDVSLPIIGFEPQTIAFLAKVGAFIDIDTYKNYLDEDESE
ncbi:MAG: DUF4279 domain-containing protein [Candidatus Sericytochromatia bacterium]